MTRYPLEIVPTNPGSLRQPVLQVARLAVSYPIPAGVVHALQGVSLDLYPGETLALIGESGCGKSTLGRALLGLLPPPGRIQAGQIHLAPAGQANLAKFLNHSWRRLRGQAIGLILQDPVQALNPVLTIGRQVSEALRSHRRLPAPVARQKGLRLLQQMGLAEPERVFRAYPFQLSGGMCQRVAIAVALANSPPVLIADEPTTALDVRVQAAILRLLRQLQRELGLALLLITHDIGVAAALADRVAIMYAGRIVEIGAADTVLGQPGHPYTQALLNCLPQTGKPAPQPLEGQPPDLLTLPDHCPFIPRCPRVTTVCRQQPPPPLAGLPRVACYQPAPAANVTLPLVQSAPVDGRERVNATRNADRAGRENWLEVVDLYKQYHPRTLFTAKDRPVIAVKGISFTIDQNEIVGLVGESGCGKSTLARCILRLEPPSAGMIRLAGQDLLNLRGEALRQVRRQIQPVFQSPRGSLNPGRTALALVQEPLEYFDIGHQQARLKRAGELLELVGLAPDAFGRRPDALSTGQCQRVAIARALALQPELLIADEPVSALDLSVQAQILQLLTGLHRQLNFSMLFISHNLLVVQTICRRVMVMLGGLLCEILPAQRMAETALHPYTRALLADTPHLGQRIEAGPKSTTQDGQARPPTGCPFAPQCPLVVTRCWSERPPLVIAGPHQTVACHRREELQPATPAALETGFALAGNPTGLLRRNP